MPRQWNSYIHCCYHKQSPLPGDMTSSGSSEVRAMATLCNINASEPFPVGYSSGHHGVIGAMQIK